MSAATAAAAAAAAAASMILVPQTPSTTSGELRQEHEDETTQGLMTPAASVLKRMGLPLDTIVRSPGISGLSRYVSTYERANV